MKLTWKLWKETFKFEVSFWVCSNIWGMSPVEQEPELEPQLSILKLASRRVWISGSWRLCWRNGQHLCHQLSWLKPPGTAFIWRVAVGCCVCFSASWLLSVKLPVCQLVPFEHYVQWESFSCKSVAKQQWHIIWACLWIVSLKIFESENIWV